MITPKKIKLAHTPTPIERVVYNGTQFLMKRDDFTGSEMSGNKVRKLEYLMYQAVAEKADVIFTVGYHQSNHARATAVAATKLGIKTKLFLWGRDYRIPEGNFFIDKFLGSDFRFLREFEFRDSVRIMREEKEEAEKKGLKVYIIPGGGSNALGIWGYIDFIKELKEQPEAKSVKGILVPAGTGGTAAGLLLGCAIHKCDLNIYIVNVDYTKYEMRSKILKHIRDCSIEYDIKAEINEANLNIFDGYSNEGYKDISLEKVGLIKDFARKTGIILDPAYTGKAFVAYYENFLKNSKSTDIMFLHTGGLLGIFDKRTQYLG